MDTIQFEGIKTGLRQSKEGYMLTLAVHPEDVPDDLMRDYVGSRYMVVMVRIGDDEKPMNREQSFPGDTAVQVAGLLCRDPEFWDFLHDSGWLEDKNEVSCKEFLHTFLHIDSRKELKTSSEARDLFKQIRKSFESWKQS